MSDTQENMLRALLKRFGSRTDGNGEVLIDRLAHLLAGKDFCIKAHEAIAKQSLPLSQFSVEESIEYLVKVLPEEFEFSIRAQLDHDLAVIIAYVLSMFRAGETMDKVAHLDKVSRDFAEQIDKHLMPTIVSLREQLAHESSRNRDLAGQCARQGRMIAFIQERLHGDPGALLGWEAAFESAEIARREGLPVVDQKIPTPEYLTDTTRLSDHMDKVVFIRSSDNPTVLSMLQAMRRYSPVAFVFLGIVPEVAQDFIGAGYKVFSMAQDTQVPSGALIGRPSPLESGNVWEFCVNTHK